MTKAFRVAALMAIAICGCGSTPPPTGTITPEAVPSSSSFTGPSESTPMALATETMAPVITRPPGSTAGAWPVMMTLNEAKREVLSWSIPEIGARVERSAYVLKADLFEALDPDGEGLLLRDNEVDVAYTRDDYLGQPIIMVELSQTGMAALIQDRFEGTLLRDSHCIPSSRSGTVTAFFDASRGTFIGHLVEAVPDSLWATAATSAVSSSRVTATASATESEPTATRGPTLPTPTQPGLSTDAKPRELGEGEVPAALRRAVETLPWVVGSRWTYRVTSMLNGMRWQTQTVTETVAGATRLADDVMEVRVAQSPPRRVPWQSRWWVENMRVPWQSGWWDDNRAFIVPSGAVVGLGEEASIDTFRSTVEALATGQREWRHGDPVELVRLPLRSPDVYGSSWRVLGEEPRSLPAGAFPSCYALKSYVSTSSTWTHWLCPGVGIVLHDLPSDFYTSSCGYEVWELVDYHIPEIITVR